MALELFCWGPSLDLLRDLRNGALWLEHWKLLFSKFVSSDRIETDPEKVKAIATL